MREILASGTQASTGEQYQHHVLFLLKSGSSDVDIQVADADDDLTSDDTWRDSGVALEADGVQARVVFTSPGVSYRVKVDADSGWDCVVAVDRINEPTEHVFGSLS